MANIKSQKKRILTAEKARQRNRAVKSQLKTAVRRVREAVEAKNGVQAYVAAQEACRLLDKAASKGVIHKNQAANRKSGVMALANTVVTAEDIAAAPKREKKMPVAKDGGKKAAKKAERQAAKQAAYEAAAKEKAVRREATLKAEAAAHEAKAKAEAEAAAAEAAEGAEEAAE
ncbi:MAG: 30S ribosomal protein S20 [Slackia sp.]|nr:30S ribosomal protein S20 [Slackia sp.]